ncbi:hypothetical protein SALBM217S_07430 [Streptomyces griseoloalbus]
MFVCAALPTELLDALAEEVEEGGDKDRALGELEQREHLRDGLDDLGDGARGDSLGRRVHQGPGVEEGDPAAQDGGVVAVPGVQPPAGAGGVAVQLDESGEPGAVPAGPDLAGCQVQCGRGPFLGGAGSRACTECRVGAVLDGGPRAIRTASARTCRAWRASSARGGVPSGGLGAGRVRRVVTARRAVASARGRTSRSLELRANGSSGFRDVTGAVFPLTARKPNRNRTPRRIGLRRGRQSSGVRKRRRDSS